MKTCLSLDPEKDREVITHDPWPAMPADKFNAISEFCRWAADKIGLRDWLLLMMFETADHHLEDSEAGACCQVVYGRKVLQIWLSEDFNKHTDDEQKHMLIHELFHAHTNGLLSSIEVPLRMHLGSPVWDMLYAGYRERLEILTDTLAVEFSRFLIPAYKEKPSEEVDGGHDGRKHDSALDRLSTDHPIPADTSGPLADPAIGLADPIPRNPSHDGGSFGDHPPAGPSGYLGGPIPR